MEHTKDNWEGKVEIMMGDVIHLVKMAELGYEEKYDAELKLLENNLKSFIRQVRYEAYTEGFIEGQKHAFGVDKERVRDEAVREERAAIWKEWLSLDLKATEIEGQTSKELDRFSIFLQSRCLVVHTEEGK